MTYQPHAVLNIPAEGDMADPHVIKVGCSWYLYATNDKEGLDVWVSDDLATWRHLGRVWERTPGSWNDQGEVWAPHVEAAEDGYFLYYTAYMQIGVARADGPEGPFVDVYDHPLVGGGHGGVGGGTFAGNRLSDFREYAIDAFVLRTSGGDLALYHTAYDPLSHLLVQPLSDYTTLEGADATEALRPLTDTWEAAVVEAPWVLEQGGRYHLMYSGNGANTADYALGAAVGDDPYGPFDRYPDNPWLEKDPEATFWGPGHHSVVAGARGDLLAFYHTKSGSEVAWDRRIRYVPVSWSSTGRLQMDDPLR